MPYSSVVERWGTGCDAIATYLTDGGANPPTATKIIINHKKLKT